MDVQFWHGEGALLRYVSGYASKYGEAITDENLDVSTTAVQTALHICRSWRAGAPEQMMTLARESMSFSSMTTKTYRPTTFDNDPDVSVYLYRRRPADLEDLSFLAWLRVHTVTGNLASGDGMAKATAGATGAAVGVEYYSFPTDAFFWQWMVMNVPHRGCSDLLPKEVWKVSENFRFYTAALLLQRESWDNDLWID
eukprot:2889952-Pyramimonas_sp.AAC.1